LLVGISIWRTRIQVLETQLASVKVIQPKVFADQRGFFLESYNERVFREMGIEAHFVQDNHSSSQRGVLRGLHYQIQQPQGKLIRVLQGEVFDVAVDLRRKSPDFGKWTGVTLSKENHRMLWIPPCFAHGFLVLSEVAEVAYKATDYYAPQWERSLLWNDPAIDIAWPEMHNLILSEKDRKGRRFSEAEVYE
jgi:dTDP-4-dehydrorhamnose 3,5-epimerase